MVTLEKTSFKDKFLKSLQALPKQALYVGIPEGGEARGEDGVTPAYLLDLHSRGSEASGLPKREVIQPVLEASADYIKGELEEYSKLKLEGRESEAEIVLETLGLELQARIQDWFEDPRNGWEPNKPATIKAKQGDANAEDVTLVDTGLMRQSITYVVKEEDEEEVESG